MFRVLYRLLAGLARLAVRSGRSKDLEIVVLRHQLTVLRRHTNKPALTDTDRILMAAVAKALPRARRAGWIVNPETLLRWHRRRIARHWTQPHRPPGRPPVIAEIRRLTLAMAADNPTWGYRRICGELGRVGHVVGASTVWRILRDAHIDPAPNRTAVAWSQFLKSQAAVATDFATIDTATLRRQYLLFFIDINTRTVFRAGITAHPTGLWTTQAARNLFLRHGKSLQRCRGLVRDRGSQFTTGLDETFTTPGVKVLKTPVRTPEANAFAERWIGTLHRELLDRTTIWNRRQPNASWSNTSTTTTPTAPHRSLDQQPPHHSASGPHHPAQ